MEINFDSFVNGMFEKSELLKISRKFIMDTPQKFFPLIDDDVEINFEAEGCELTQSPSLTFTLPLYAKPLSFKSNVSHNSIEEFLKNGLNKASYYIGECISPEFEKCGLYANHSSERNMRTEGILKQLKDMSASTDLGFSKLIENNNMINGICEALNQFTDNGGANNNAVLFLPQSIYFEVKKEMENKDKINFDFDIVNERELNDVMYGWDKQKFDENGWITTQEGKEVSNLKYGILTKKNNIAFGIYKDINIKHDDIDRWELAMKSDVKIIKEQHTIALPFKSKD